MGIFSTIRGAMLGVKVARTIGKAWKKGGGSTVAGVGAPPLAVVALGLLEQAFPMIAENAELRANLLLLLTAATGWIIGAVKEWGTDTAEKAVKKEN